MKSLVQQITISILLGYLIVSCAPVYIPTAHNVPMFLGKKEFQGSLGVGTGFNAQAAYSITDHMAIATNYLYASHDEVDNGRKHQTGEIAFGYYTNVNDKWCFEVFAGYGFGKGSAYDSSYSYNLYFDPLLSDGSRYEANGKFNKIYIQPSIGIRSGRFVWSLSTKLSYIDFKRIDIKLNEQQVWNKRTSKMFGSFVGDGVAPIWKQIFMHYQVGLNLPFGKEPLFDYRFFVGSVGLVIKTEPTAIAQNE